MDDKVLRDWDHADQMLDNKIAVLDEHVINLEEYEKNRIAENLMIYPYRDLNVDYATVDVNNGVITINKTNPEREVRWILHPLDVFTPLTIGKYYTVSVGFNSELHSKLIFIEFYDEKSGVRVQNFDVIGDILTFKAEHPYMRLAFKCEIGYTVDNLVIKPMLEEGTVAHEYQPPIYSRKSLEERITVLENALLELTSLMEE